MLILSTCTRVLHRYFNLSRLTGPIFDKELRVSSRRRRNYILRFFYPICLTLFVALVWVYTVDISGSVVYRASRMAEAATTIIATIIGFQFVAIQIIAVIMLSSAISDEIQHQTLGTLMTTPISSFQIVLGKLFSKLLQLILLLVISLPLMAIVRVFGGVPWKFVVTGLCITLTAGLFAGSLSLFLSVGLSRAYAVMIKTFFLLFVLFAFVPVLGYYLFDKLLPSMSTETQFTLLMYFNPFVALQYSFNRMAMPVGFTFHWPIHCLIMLTASTLLLAYTIRVVRRIAIRQATGDLNLSRKKIRSGKSKNSSSQSHPPVVSSATLRPVKGQAVCWKESRTSLIKGGRRKGMIGLAAAVIALLATYGMQWHNRILDEGYVHNTYISIFMFMGLIYTIVISATSITTEKESRTWPLLLTTTLNDWQILFGKAYGVLRRCLPIWLFLIGHLLLFIARKYIHVLALVYMPLVIISTLVFLMGSGLYFSARCKRTSSAVISNLGLVLILWMVIPFILGILSETTLDVDSFYWSINMNPVVQTEVIIPATAGARNATRNVHALNFRWPMGGWKTAGDTNILVIGYTLLYCLLGVFLTWRAKVRFRRNIF